MAKDADAHGAEDKSQRGTIDAKNQLDSVVYQIEQMLKIKHGSSMRRLKHLAPS